MIVYQASLNYLKKNSLQSLFVILGIALGIAVTFAIDIAIDSAQKSFSLSAQRITGKATHKITAVDNSDIEQALYKKLKNNLGISDIAPVIETFVPVIKNKNSQALEQEISLTQSNNDRELIKILGVDPLAETKFRDFNLGFDFSNDFKKQHINFICSKNTADKLNLSKSSSIKLRIGSQIKDVYLLGFFEDDSQQYDNLFLFDLAQAQELLDKQGYLTRIDLKSTTADKFENFRAQSISKQQLQEFIGAQYLLEDFQNGKKALTQMTKSFNVNLQALSFLAIIVAAFLIFNSVSFSVVQRRKVFAVLRTIGVSKEKIIKIVLFEAFIFAVLGISLGLFLGYTVADKLVALVLQTINDIYFSVEVSVKSISIWSLAKSLGLGFVTCVLAAFFPAFDASSTSPILAMSRSGFEKLSQVKNRVNLFLAIVFALAAIFVLQIKIDFDFLPIIFNEINLAFLSLLLFMLAFTVLIPSFIKFLVSLLKPIYTKLFSFVGSFSIQSISKQLSRTAIAITALTIALSMVLALDITVSSFRKTVENWLDKSLKADVYISIPRLVSNQASEFIPLDLQENIKNNYTKDIKTFLTYSMLNTETSVGKIQVAAIEKNQEALELMKFTQTSKGFWQEILNDSDSILVSEPFINKYQKNINDLITITTKYGKKDFKIVAVFQDFGSEHGIIMMSKQRFQKEFAKQEVNSIGLLLHNPNQVQEFIEKLKQDLFEKHLLFIRSNISLKNESLDIFDRTFQITNVLKIIALAVAFIAILSSFMALQLERVREFAILKASGTSNRQISAILVLQTVTMGIFAFLFALPVGILQAFIMIFVINKRSFGWTLEWNLTNQFFLEIFALAFVASILSVCYPIFFTNKVKLSEVLRND